MRLRAASLVMVLCMLGCPSGGEGGPPVPEVSGTRTAGAAGSSAPAPRGGGDRSGAESPVATPPRADVSAVVAPLSQLPSIFAAAVCGAMLDCLGATRLREFTLREDCEERLSAELRATQFAHMVQAIDRGHVLYSPARLEECTDAIRALGCEVVSDALPEACLAVLAGTVDLGGECAIDAECEGGAYCAGADACPSTCVATLGAGAACSRDAACGDGLRCLAGVCGVPAADGEPCGGAAACGLGLSCLGAGEGDGAAGVCVPNAMLDVGELGEPCDPDQEQLCRDGLSCVFDGVSGFSCEAQVALGAACHLGWPGQCPHDAYCDASEVTLPGICRPLPGEGEPCAQGGQCGGGLACVDAAEAVCMAIQDNGGSCVADAACRSGRCVEGACAAPPACL